MTNQESIELQTFQKLKHWKLASCQCVYTLHFEDNIFAIDTDLQRKE